jgi:two-component system sensor histidine kinase FlrB
MGDFLQKVYATVAILQSRLPPSAALERETLSRLKNHAANCRDLLDAIQDFLCPIHLSREPVDLCQLVAELAEAFRPRCPQIAVAAPQASIPLFGDPERLRQVGRILVENAVEAGSAGLMLQVGTDAAGATAVWECEDLGPGMNPEIENRIFEPFFTTRAGHAGLGLPLARKIVELHDGNINACNSDRSGFKVTITIPTAQDK